LDLEHLRRFRYRHIPKRRRTRIRKLRVGQESGLLLIQRSNEYFKKHKINFKTAIIYLLQKNWLKTNKFCLKIAIQNLTPNFPAKMHWVRTQSKTASTLHPTESLPIPCLVVCHVTVFWVRDLHHYSVEYHDTCDEALPTRCSNGPCSGHFEFVVHRRFRFWSAF
jgi:hypothetical protein